MGQQVTEDNSLTPDDIAQVRRVLENLTGIDKTEPKWVPAEGKYVYQVTLYNRLNREQLWELAQAIYSLPSHITAEMLRVGNFMALRFY